MSLIERALDRMRKVESSAPTLAPRQRVAVEAPIPQHAAVADLVLTDAMRIELGLVPPPGTQRQRSAEFRHIKRHIVGEIQANPKQRVIMVASALAGEGKTFTAANLAESLAMEADFSVLLIDGDVVKPRLTRALGLSESPGLMDTLVDRQRVPESVVQTTDVRGLSVLPVGARHENATEHFAADRMREVIRSLLAVENRIIVIDSLPLLQTTEATSLALVATQILLVVRAESTPEPAIRRALDLLGDNANVKLILNALVRTKLARSIGYGYGYGYEYSEQDGESAAS